MPDQIDLTTVDLQDLVAMVYAEWDHVNPHAASYLNALDVNDCHEFGDPVGDETAETRVRDLHDLIAIVCGDRCGSPTGGGGQHERDCGLGESARTEPRSAAVPVLWG
jgi:hypothetical protein